MSNYALIDFGSYEESIVKSHELSNHNCALIVGQSNSNYFRNSERIYFYCIENFFDYKNIDFNEKDYKFFLTIYELVDRCAQRWTVKNINHDDRFNLYFRGFCNSVYILYKTNTKTVFSGTSSPHHLYNLLFYYAAKRLGIPTYFLSQIFISNRLNIVEGIEKKLWKLSNPYQCTNLIENYIKQVRSDNTIRPFYVAKYFSVKHNLIGNYYIFAILKNLKSILRSFVDFLKRKKNSSVSLIPYSKSYSLYFWLKILKNIIYLPILKIFYYRNITSDLPKNYIIFFAPYQPEASSQPDAEFYSDPRLVLQHLKTIISEDVKIVYKEHPTKFLYFIQGFGTQIMDHRSIEYYRDLIKMGIHLIDSRQDSRELILQSKLVAGINGTFVIESVILGKPVIYYGNAWYGNIPFAKKINFDDKLSDFKFDEYKDHIDSVKQHLLKLESNSLPNIFGVASLNSEIGNISDFCYEFARILDN